MSAIHNLSSDTPVGQLSLFGVPPTQREIERDIVSEHRPISTLDSTQPVEFVIQTAPDEYVNLNELILYLSLHIELSKTDKTPVTALDWSKVTPVNNLFHSIFENIELFIGDTQVNSTSSSYHYRAFFDTLLNLNKQSLESYMTAALYDDSEAIRRNYIAPENFTSSKTSVGKSLDLAGTPFLDLAFQPRAILGGSTIRLKLIPNKSEFYLMIGDEKIQANVVFENCSLEVHRSKVFNQVVVAHNEALKIKPCQISYISLRGKNIYGK